MTGFLRRALYEEPIHTDNGTCKGNTNYIGQPLMADFTFDWAYTSTFYGYADYEVFYIAYQGYWYPFRLASLDEATGEFSYENGYEDYPYGGNYYTSHQLLEGVLTTSSR